MINSTGYFIDKLNVAQEHYSNNLNLVGKDMIIVVDMETGDQRQAPSKLQLEGSYSSSLMIRCNGSRVEVYGNPSRYHRIDNLFGLTTFDECIAVYNQVFLSLDLPPFTKCKKLMSVQNEATKKVSWLADGACIKHVDFTINHAVDWLGKNLTQNGSTHRYIKCYAKSIKEKWGRFIYDDKI